MTTLRESLCLFAPWRKRNYLFEYLYSSLAISISGTPRCPPARRAGGPQEHAGRLYGGVGRGAPPGARSQEMHCWAVRPSEAGITDTQART